MEKSKIKTKVCLVGEFAVGKTSLVKSFIQGEFQNYYSPTVGANVIKKKIDIYDRSDSLCEIDLNIWDLSGQEKWEKLRSSYLKGAQGVFIVADLTRSETFKKIESHWYPEIKKIIPIGTPIILICNKKDLKPKVDDQFIEIFAARLKFDSVVKTSAKTNQNVNYSFFLLLNSSINLKNQVLAKIP